MLKDSLPGVIRNLEAEEESLEPKFERSFNAFERANKKVAEYKQLRDNNQNDARSLISDVKASRERVLEKGGMVSLDPKWKRAKLIEDLEHIEHKIQTSALDHKSEKKLLEKRRALISENDRWLNDRKNSNPEMEEYIGKSREMSKLFKSADEAHAKMLGGVGKAQPLYDKQESFGTELRDVRSQLDRARELLSQSDKAIGHWERRLKEGFGDMGPGFPDLLDGMKKVAEGGMSSFAKKSRRRKAVEIDGGEEE
jgi:uncharacterized coiled-coil DUF342 family protein